MTCSSVDEVQWISKDPDDKLDYATNWTNRLVENETITNSQWLIDVPVDDPSPLEVASNPAPTVAGGLATAWFTGGTLGTTYTVVNRITTDQGRIQDRSKFITIEQH